MAVTRQPEPTPGPAAFVPPQNLDAEESIIGALMLAPAAIKAAGEEVSPEDFYRHSHANIFRAALTLSARGDTVDAITLTAELDSRGQLEDIGGKIRIHELAALVPAASNIRHYCRLVRECAHRRSLLIDLQRVSQQALSGEWDMDGVIEALRTVADARAIALDPAPALRFLTLREFIEQPLAGVEPLLGTGKDRLLVEGSFAILGGPGGVGKTTLALHMAAHLCSGKSWFGIPVTRPLRIVLIEAEGPHDPFAEKVKEFVERWDGPDFSDNMIVYDAPWGQFTWEDKRKAGELRAAARDFEADFVLANPLSRLGMKGAGTPEETNAFLDVLYRSGLSEDFGALLIHHTRKGQGGPKGKNGVTSGSPLDELSGAWGAHPDLVMMLVADGERRVKLSFEKARWGDKDAHGPFVLYFETEEQRPVGYRMMEATARTSDGELYERIDQCLRDHNEPLRISKLRELVTGNSDRIAACVRQGVRDGRYVSDGAGQPKFWLAGEEPVLWPRDDQPVEEPEWEPED